MTTTHLTGAPKLAVQAVWLVLVGLLLSTFAAGVPVRFNHLLRLVSRADQTLIAGLPAGWEDSYASGLGLAEADVLRAWGVSRQLYAGYLVTFEVGLALTCAVIAVFIFWRRSDDWLTVWFSLTLVLLGTNSVTPEVIMLGTVWPGAGWVAAIAAALGMISNVHLWCLSPDGRFVPRWTIRLAAGFAGGMLALGIVGASIVRRQGLLAALPLALVAAIVWLALMGSGVGIQIYRYRRVSGPIERQQTKWVFVGLVAVALGFVLNAVLFSVNLQPGVPRVLINLVRTPLVHLCMLMLPICVAFSMLRYRLWDIDLIIRRTLIYSSVTAALAAVYFSSVVLLQAVFGAMTGQRQSPLVTVISTLAIAALFVPARRRVQDFIDRHFYRRKYDATKTLAAFSASMRDETDLETLTERLVNGVVETMQPARISLWIKPGVELRKP